MTELAKRYRIFSGLMHFDIDKIIEETPYNERPFLFRKLMWNLQKGLRLSLQSRLGKEFAWLVCNLATACNLNVNAEDIIPDGTLTYDDWITHIELKFAHQLIKDCEHSDDDIDGTVLFGDFEAEIVLMSENNEVFLVK